MPAFSENIQVFPFLSSVRSGHRIRVSVVCKTEEFFVNVSLGGALVKVT